MGSTWTPPSGWAPQAYGPPRAPEQRRGWRWPLVVWAVASVLATAVGCLVVLAGVGASAARNTDYETVREPSAAMVPTYAEGAKVTIKRISGGTQVHRGDVVLFSGHDWQMDKLYLKRVVAVGGDHVVMSMDPHAKLVLNGRPVDEPYVKDGVVNAEAPVNVTVPAGRLFLLGDHRADSLDSRFHQADEHKGTIARSAVLGIAVDPSTVPSYHVRALLLSGAGTAAAGLLSAVVAVVTGVRRTRRLRMDALAFPQGYAPPWPAPYQPAHTGPYPPAGQNPPA